MTKILTSGSGTNPAIPSSRASERFPAQYSADADFLTVREASAFLRCSKSYLDKLRCAGGGPVFIRAGVRKILYRRADLSDWMRARRFDNTSQYVE